MLIWIMEDTMQYALLTGMKKLETGKTIPFWELFYFLHDPVIKIQPFALVKHAFNLISCFNIYFCKDNCHNDDFIHG